jgi:penicillin-binding protein 2
LVGYTAKADQNRLSQAKKYGLTPQTMVGYSGVEEQYDGELKGGDGGLQIEVNSRGEQVRLLGWKDPTAGNDFIVTVDSRIQEAAMKALGEARGAVVMMDADTGEILTLASAPSYDPNAFKESDRRDEINSYFRDRRSPMLNRAIGGVYPPGSIFKVIVGVAGIDQSKINRTNRYRCNGFLELGGTRFGCTHVHGDENLEEALGHSCNVYFYHLGLVLGADVIHRYASIFGMGKLTRVDLPYEKKGGLPLRSQHLAAGKRWFTGDTLNISIGQGDVLATPIQMAALMATVLNNGDTVQPQVKYQDPRPERKGNFFPRSNIGLSAAVFAEIKKGLRFAVADPDGTAHVLSEIPGLSVAGKTGTAQAGHDRDHHAWFAGYVEKGFNRRIAFCVFLEHGGSSHNACLVARNILAEVKEKGLL